MKPTSFRLTSNDKLRIQLIKEKYEAVLGRKISNSHAISLLLIFSIDKENLTEKFNNINM